MAEAANYPFCTIEPNTGIVPVPDNRLDKLAKIADSAKIIYSQLEFVDIAGLVKDASKGEGLGNQFLGHIREVDAIAHVVRCFEDENITHVEGSIDPIRDLEIIETELLLSDIESLEKQKNNLEKKIRGNDKEAKIKLSLIEKIYIEMSNGIAARKIESLSSDENNLLRELNLITIKPILYVCNLSEEAHGWTTANGSKAPQAAGKIHTDFEKGFIRAETISYSDYINFNGESGAKDAGKMRVEGSDYLVKDGDIFHFRFNI